MKVLNESLQIYMSAGHPVGMEMAPPHSGRRDESSSSFSAALCELIRAACPAHPVPWEIAP
jgi:hypothetical protein